MLKKGVIIKVGEDEYILYNPYTQVADIVDGEVVKGLETLKLSEDVLQYLKRHQHITEESDLEKYAYEEYNRAYEHFSSLTRYYLIPTYNCNMRCIYCYEKGLRKEKKVMDKKTLESFFEVVHKDTKANHIILYGGEPLQSMTKPWVEHVSSFCNEKGYTLSVCTNGLEMEEFKDILSRFSRITVTLDGIEGVQDMRRPAGNKGSFTRVVENIESVIEEGIPLTISINADAQNIDDLPALASFFISKGWHTIASVELMVSHIIQSLTKDYKYILEPGDAYKKMVELYEEYPQMEIFLPSIRGSNPLVNIFFKGEEWRPKYWYCGANSYMLFFDPYGYIYPCYMVVGKQKFAIGQFHPHFTFFSHAKTWRERSCFSIPQCRECSYSFFCGGGCAYRQYLRSGSLSDPYCDIVKGMAEWYVPFLHKKMKEKGEPL